MYCESCGEKLDNDSKFCTNCGEKVAIDESSMNTESISNTIICEGKPCKFLDKLGNILMETEHAGSNNWIIKRQGNVYLSLKFRINGSEYIYDVIDENYNQIGVVSFKSFTDVSLNHMSKTRVFIKDMKKNEYLLEENIGKITSVAKALMPSHYGVGSIMSARTGDMIIKFNGRNIGLITSKRGVLNNTYTIEDIANFENQIDIRLILASMAFLSVKRK